jgi:hypothetical protein
MSKAAESGLRLSKKRLRGLVELFSAKPSEIFDFSQLDRFLIRKLERYKRQALRMSEREAKRKK